MLGALQVADDGMRNRSAWTTSGQSHGSMFSQDTNGSSCLSSEASKLLFEGDKPSLPIGFGLISMMRGSMWKHLAPHDAPRPWQRRAMVGKDGF